MVDRGPLVAVHVLDKDRVAPYASPAPLLPQVRLQLIGGFAGREHDEDLPQVLAIVEPRKATVGGAGAKAVKGVQHDVVFIFDAPRRVARLHPRSPISRR